ncbi:phage minor head protein [Planomonospora corallina]|uniref:Phage minor head protein n=1 Tax=Planomonospora corallina TaxID=1806052 RepID=A0ABV8IAP4_9ACTN
MTGRDPRQVQRDAADRALARLEDLVEAAVQQALGQVAADYAAYLAGTSRRGVTASLDDGELRRIADLWAGQLRKILAVLLAVFEAAARAIFRRFGVPLPPDVEDLPGRWLDDPFSVPDRVQAYLTTATNRLSGVGDRLWEAARQALADGVAAGEGVDQLRDRLQETFAAGGVQLGAARAERIARTEVVSVWNRASLDAAMGLPDGARPAYKTWLATADERTRPAHWEADGFTVPLAAPFMVAGEPLLYPGDPAGSPAVVINCRCTCVFGSDAEPPDDDGRQYLDEQEIARVVAFFEEQGIVRDAHASADLSAAADGSHLKGAMIALMPARDDAERLAVDGGEAPDDLHLTLLYLGGPDGSAWDDNHRSDLAENVRAAARSRFSGPVTGTAFGVNHWNPGSDEPSWVWAVGDDRDRPAGAPRLQDVRDAVTAALDDTRDHPEIPAQHSPWVPHVCAAYSSNPGLLSDMVQRLGPITFDRIRLAFAGDVTDIPLGPATDQEDAMTTVDSTPRRWSTPSPAALAFENTETGDGRIFAPRALYWEAGPWPLQYADEMLHGHEGAELAGAIDTIGRDGDRIPSTGVLYPSQASGAAAIRLLEEGAPLGVSVDLDDVDVEFVDRRPTEPDTTDEEEVVVMLASLAAVSVLPLPGGSHLVSATHRVEHTAAGAAAPVQATHTVQWTTGPGGRIPAAALRAALHAAGVVTAAAGDPDDPNGTVLHAEQSGELVMRITRARVRGATLVSMPAFAQARIFLDADPAEQAASAAPPPGRMGDVVTYVATSPVPVGALDVATALDMTVASARDYLVRAVAAGYITRLARGLYVAAATLPEASTAPAEVTASMCGDTGLPIHDGSDAAWDGDAAASRVLEWATGVDGVDVDRLSAAFLWRDDDADPATLAAYRLGIADVAGGELRIIPGGVFAAADALHDGDGGVPAGDQEQLRDRVARLYERLAEHLGDPALAPPWQEAGEGMDELEASAWQQFQDLPPLPASWFREPTPEELPPGSGGVHVRAGRVYGWVAQRGVPHEAYPGRRLTIESLGELDFSAFLRSRFQLDDGSVVRVGAMTMNAGHHRDGAECETAACQWDDTRTVAGIVTVGMSDGGLWFSGAAAPWLSQWDQMVFSACQPSYHVRQLPSGRWSLRAVLSVPVPGHPSELVAASAVVDRSNMALAASTAGGFRAGRPAGWPATRAAGPLAGASVEEVVERLADELERRAAARAEIEQLAQLVAPARAEVAAGLAAQMKEGA